MSKIISFNLSSKSIAKAIKELEEYKTWVEIKTKELIEKLAYIGAKEATVRFGGAYYSGNNDVKVSVEPTMSGCKIIAEGKAVFFIEFGAGVYYNGSEPYPEPRPDGIVGIGEYGKGKGKQTAWGYYDENDNVVITHGTPASMPMYHAKRVMIQEIEKIAREVFK